MVPLCSEGASGTIKRFAVKSEDFKTMQGLLKSKILNAFAWFIAVPIV